MKSILIKAFALLTVMAVLLTGCAATPEATEAPTEAPATEAPAASEEPAASEAPAASEEPAASTLSGELMITGSTSAEPLVTVFGDLFMEANPDVSVAVQGNGLLRGHHRRHQRHRAAGHELPQPERGGGRRRGRHRHHHLHGTASPWSSTWRTRSRT